MYIVYSNFHGSRQGHYLWRSRRLLAPRLCDSSLVIYIYTSTSTRNKLNTHFVIQYIFFREKMFFIEIQKLTYSHGYSVMDLKKLHTHNSIDFYTDTKHTITQTSKWAQSTLQRPRIATINKGTENSVLVASIARPLNAEKIIPPCACMRFLRARNLSRQRTAHCCTIGIYIDARRESAENRPTAARSLEKE